MLNGNLFRKRFGQEYCLAALVIGLGLRCAKDDLARHCKPWRDNDIEALAILVRPRGTYSGPRCLPAVTADNERVMRGRLTLDHRFSFSNERDVSSKMLCPDVDATPSSVKLLGAFVA